MGGLSGDPSTVRATPRQHYVDWLRVLAVLLLFPFHVSRVFNVEPFYVKSAHLSEPLGYVLGFISHWHMQLLFLLAGMSTYYALGKRRGGRYLSERVKRLLVPLVFGFFVLIPPQTWYGGRFNSGYEGSFWHYLTSGDFLVWNVRDGGDYYGGWGIGHLWFIMILFILSVVVLPLLLWGRSDRGSRTITRMSRALGNPAWWLLVGFAVLIGEALPDPAGLGPFYYLVFFVLGYLIVADPRFIETAVRWRWPAVAAGAALSVFWVLTNEVRDSLPDPSLQLLALVYPGQLGTWLALVGILGLGKHYLDKASGALSYLAEGSYPVYILHQTVIVVLAFYIVGMAGGGVAEWIVLLALSVTGTFALYEIVRRVSPLRFLFGMKGRRPRSAAESPAVEPAFVPAGGEPATFGPATMSATAGPTTLPTTAGPAAMSVVAEPASAVPEGQSAGPATRGGGPVDL
jgi:peptidoglycan/LPS O-acetylase OafA/YrhL